MHVEPKEPHPNLGRNIRQRAPLLECLRPRRLIDKLSETKIRNTNTTTAHKDIGWLQVAMKDRTINSLHCGSKTRKQPKKFCD